MERKNMSYPFWRFHISREWRIKWRDNPVRKIEKLQDWRWVVTLRDLNRMWKNRKVVIAREVYRLWVWPIKEWEYVYHIDWNMDNNVPENLAIWDMYDMTANKKSRWKLHHQINMKLSASDVKKIRKEYKKKKWPYDRKISCRTLAKKYKISPQTISSVVCMTTWKKNRTKKTLYVKP